MLGRNSTVSSADRYSDIAAARRLKSFPSSRSQIEAAKIAEAGNVYGHGFGFDVSVIDKGKGKANILNIHKDAEMSNETPKESMESSTSSSSSFSFVHAHYPDPLGFLRTAGEKPSSSSPSGTEKPSSSSYSGTEKPRFISPLYSTEYPKAPFNTPATSREDLTGAGGWGLGT